MSDECAATLSSVTHRYGDVVALAGLDLEIRSGEVLAVLGPNGAGRTTAIGLLLGSLRVPEGVARVFGQPPGAKAVRLRRGAMLQVSGVADTLTVAEHLELFGSGRIPDFPVTRSHPPASWPSAANSSICRTYRKTAGEESRRRSPVANRWMRP